MTSSRNREYAEFALAAQRGKMPTHPSSSSDHSPPPAIAESEMSAFSPQTPSLEPNRAKVGGEFFPSVTLKRDLLISLSSSKMLTELVCAVVSGPQAAADVDVLDRLVAEAHRLAQGWGTKIVEQGQQVPAYLHASLLKQACRFLAANWKRDGTIDAQRVLDLGAEAFKAQVASLDQNFVNTLEDAPDNAATSPEQARQQIRTTLSAAYWRVVTAVSSISAVGYGLAGLVDDPQDRFLYGLNPERIASDLIEHILFIADENRLDTQNVELSTAWYRNAINRLTSLMVANYVAVTKMVVSDIDSNAPTAAAQVRDHFQMYEQVIERCQQIVREQFVTAERVAIEKMSATAFSRELESSARMADAGGGRPETATPYDASVFQFSPGAGPSTTAQVQGDSPIPQNNYTNRPARDSFKYSF